VTTMTTEFSQRSESKIWRARNGRQRRLDNALIAKYLSSRMVDVIVCGVSILIPPTLKGIAHARKQAHNVNMGSVGIMRMSTRNRHQLRHLEQRGEDHFGDQSSEQRLASGCMIRTVDAC
jgi:hypothetical protein